MRLPRIVTVLLFTLVAQWASGQIYNPVKWKVYHQKVNSSEYDLVFEAAIDDGWYIYSQYLESDDGPVRTSFEFTELSGANLQGKTSESGKKKSGFDEIFQMNVVKFASKAVFRQRIKVSDPSKGYTIAGGYEFMTCDDSRCLPPTYKEFSIQIPASAKTGSNDAPSDPKPNTQPATDAPPVTKSSVIASNGLPVTWEITSQRLDKDNYEVTFKAQLQAGWELYTHQTGSGGPMPFTVEYQDDEDNISPKRGFKVSGGTKITNADNTFGKMLTRYSGETTFVQRLALEKRRKVLTGTLYYTAERENSALAPQRVPFSIELPASYDRTHSTKVSNDAVTAADEPQPEEDAANAQSAATAGAAVAGDPAFKYTYADENCSGKAATNTCETSNWWIFLLGMGSGLIAIFTPCIFPMIPITVSYFTKMSGSRAKGITNALIYGFSIITIYVLLGLVVTSLFGAEALNKMSTNAVFNLIFFVVFILFALSFFGFYELTLPSSWSTWSDNAAEKRGGLLGIFFMAFTLSLVSFSCTGPIVGALLAETVNQSCGASLFGHIPVKPLFGMLGFSTALALPFALFAMFPSWLNSLPKSGGWMNAVKAFLGFLELALALKFLSTADLVNHWGIMPIEIFLVVWMLIFAAMAAYMFGLYKLPLDYSKPKATRGRIATGLLSLALVGYLAYGLVTYEPLKLLSGLAPPVTYNLFRNEAQMEYPDCPQGIRCYKDYDEALAFAKQENLPVLIDFTGHACVNCRKMEENVWGEPEVKRLLSEDYVLVSLYVDENTKLDEPYRTPEGNLVRTVGNKWAQFQIKHFNANSQPLYVLISPEEEVLNRPSGYDDVGDKERFLTFLECGLERFQSSK